MKKKTLLELFSQPNTKHGFQMAMHLLGKRLYGRKWRLSGSKMKYTGFNFSKNTVVFMASNCTAFECSIDEALDCISGNLDNVFKYKHLPVA